MAAAVAAVADNDMRCFSHGWRQALAHAAADRFAGGPSSCLTCRRQSVVSHNIHIVDGCVVLTMILHCFSSLQVADRVTVYTKSHEEDTQWVWTSTVGSHQYSIKEDDGPDKMVRGTRVVLHLKVRTQAIWLQAATCTWCKLLRLQPVQLSARSCSIAMPLCCPVD